MKARLPLFVVLGGSVAGLASLYLTWIAPEGAAPTKGGAIGLLDLLSGSVGFPANGWGTFGEAAAIAAIALILCSLVSLARPELEGRLPFRGCAIALATLTLVNAAFLRTQGLAWAAYGRLSVHLGAGAYVGGAAAFAVLLGAAATNSDELAERGNAFAAATLLTTGLVAVDVLPTFDVNTHTLSGATGYLAEGNGGYGTAVLLLIASFGLTFWFGAREPLRRIAAAAVILLLTFGGFSVLGTRFHWPYEAWLAIGCATGLLVLAVTSSRQRSRRVREPVSALALAGAALLLGSLFLNWEKACFAPRGSCYVSNGWGAGLTGGLVAIFVVLLLGFQHLAPELAVAVAIYVLGDGLSLSTTHGSLGYGAFIGFAGAALLLLAVGMQRPKAVHLGMRLIPILTCAALFALPVADITGRTPFRVDLDDPWRLALLEAAAIIVGLRLLGRWLSGPAVDDELVVLPLALLALVGLDLGEDQQRFFVSWEGWLSLALCLLLLALGWTERYGGGLERLRVPEEIWRVDRISGVED